MIQMLKLLDKDVKRALINKPKTWGKIQTKNERMINLHRETENL